MIQETFQRLLAKPVTRKEFLGYVGVLFLALVGASALFRSIKEVVGHQSGTKKSWQSGLVGSHVADGYGSNSFGS